jgi:exosortase
MSAPVPSETQERSALAARPAPARLPWLVMGWLLTLLIALFFPVLKVMVKEWASNEDMGHAFLVPLVAGYIMWQDRERIMAQPVKPFWPGLILILWAFCQMLLGFVGADFFIARTAFLLAIVGVIWTLAGTDVLRSLAFPLFLLLFMIRIPLFLYQQMTSPLQHFASAVAEIALQGIGIPVLRNGNVLELPNRQLQVIEACSGIRSLLSLTFLALAYSHFFDSRSWMKVVLFAATIPIAITFNSLRVIITGLASEYSPDWADGVYHALEGWVIFMLAMFALMTLHRLICRFTRRQYA